MSSLSLSESEIPRSGLVTPAASVKEGSSTAMESPDRVKSASVSGSSKPVESSTTEASMKPQNMEEPEERPKTRKAVKSAPSSGSSKPVASSTTEASMKPQNMEEPVECPKTRKAEPSPKPAKMQKTQKRKGATSTLLKKQSIAEEDVPTPKRPKCKAPLRICASMLAPEDHDLLESLVMVFPDCVLLRRSSRDVGDVVVAGRSARSVKVLCAVARGVAVVKKEWLYASLEKGEWVGVAPFIDAIAAEGLKRRRERKSGVFKDCGLIYVDKRTVPNRDELELIIESGDGKVTRDPNTASLCVIHPGSNALNSVCVHEDFVIESAISCNLSPIETTPSSIRESLVEAESEEY